MANTLYVFALLSVACASSVLATEPLLAKPAEVNKISGAWVGPFFKADWTFEFKNENGVWTGQYMSSKYNKWHALENVIVKGSVVSFNVVSTPQLNFSLTADEAGKMLSGSASLPNGSSIPFTAVRKE